MKKQLITISIIAILVGIVYGGINWLGKTGLVSLSKNNSTTVLLVVPPQTVIDSVFIEKIVLTEPGFLVVRAIENGKPGQIIEISPYLTTGEYEDITINLGEFYEDTTELTVVVYRDAEADKIFNDLEQPFQDSNGKATARFVASGEVVPPEIFLYNGEGGPHSMGDMAMTVVRYTNTGYEPQALTVPVGTMVQFVNERDDNMWVASNEYPAHTILPTFDQFVASPKNSTYIFTFDKVGTWQYHDHLNPEAIGVVAVTQ